MKRIVIALFVATVISNLANAQDETMPRWVQEWQRESAPNLMRDYGQLFIYRDTNLRLAPPVPEEKRVVFIGDSITNHWNFERDFPGKPYINRGIGWQNTTQMLVRFRQDVINLKPTVVVILGGTNDISGGYGPVSLTTIEENYQSMAELAHANGIRVIFASVLPVHNYTPGARDAYAMHSPEKILELNRWLKEFCRERGYTYLDYFSALVDDKGLMKQEYAEDGLHPTLAAYKIMAPLADAAVNKSLAAKN